MNATADEITPIQPANELSTYAYSYPHKSSYRQLSPAVRIADAWAREDARRLGLYVHIPFCEMRCGFCNLFTQSLPDGDFVTAYLAALQRQMWSVRAAVPQAAFQQLAVGGGTPTFLSAGQLEMLFARIEALVGRCIDQLATSIETSPATATAERLRVLADFGVERVSIGIQSFVPAETRRFGRPQSAAFVHQALAQIRAAGFPVLNVDLMYGDPAQTRPLWLESLRQAVEYRPEEVYLYPLYVRPRTGLARIGREFARQRADLYQAGRDWLCAQGYVQQSLRCFHLPTGASRADYNCQRDGMIGLGCGARSYTERLHYSTRFAVTQAGIRAILAEWIAQSEDDFAWATHGFWLTEEEQRRRFLILSLLQADGMLLAEFQERFPAAWLAELPEIADLIERNWLARYPDRYVLTPAGLQHSDVVGPLLYSPTVRERLRKFVELPALAESDLP